MMFRLTMLFAIASGVGLTGAADGAAKGSASGQNGRWVVEHVLTDPAIDNAEQRYFQDDPRLLGRFVVLAPARVEIDDGTGACTVIRRRVTVRTPSAALAAKLSRRGMGHAAHPTPADMKLAVGTGTVPVTHYSCSGPGDVPPGRIWTGAASFPLPRNRVALIWEDEVVMVLAPATVTVTHRPSFDCTRAVSPSEKAICGDPGLASWDRSVARALVLARDGGDELGPVADPQSLVVQQRVWIAERDACGARRDCLRDRMAERTDALLRR